VASIFGAAGKVIDVLLGTFVKRDGEGEFLIKSSVTLVTASVPEVGIVFGLIGNALGAKSDRIGGVVHDEINMGQVPVRPSNFTMVDRAPTLTDEEMDETLLDLGGNVAAAGIRAGADPIALHDELERVLHDEHVLSDAEYDNGRAIVEDVLEDLDDDDEDDSDDN
jgi:hypothetical protein